MRRKEKEMTDILEIHEIVKSNKICRIALVDGSKPYLIPMNYGFDGKNIYLHSAASGKKIDLISKNPNVCFQIDDSIEIIESEKACSFNTAFRSVICEGTISLLKESSDKREGLKTIMFQHTGHSDWEIPENALKGLEVLKIEIESITGKVSATP